MEVASFGALFLMLMMSSSSTVDVPSDLLGLVEPALGLELLEHKSDADSLEKLIAAALAATPAGSQAFPADLENAVLGLGSSSTRVRESSRKKLIDAGPGVRERLREVVAKDATRAEEAKKVLEAIADADETALLDAEIACTLAIRMAAENKYNRLRPIVRKAASSDNVFIRRAASDALIRLGDVDGTPPTTVPVAPSYGDAEVAALPPETRVLVSMRLPAPEAGKGKPMTISSFMKKMMEMLPVAAPGDVDSMVRKASEEILRWVRAYGNIRPERLYLANVGGIGEASGGLGILVQGLYQPGILRKAFAREPEEWTSSKVAGKTVHEHSGMRLVLLSDTSVLVLPPDESSVHFPLEKYLASFVAGKKELTANARFARFLETLAATNKLRGLAITDDLLMTEIEKEIAQDAPPEVAEAVKAMEELELTMGTSGEEKDEKIRVRFEGLFAGEQHATRLVEFLKSQIQQGIAEMEQSLQTFDFPPLRMMVDVMKSIHVSAEGKRGILRLEIPANVGGLAPMMWFSIREG